MTTTDDGTPEETEVLGICVRGGQAHLAAACAALGASARVLGLEQGEADHLGRAGEALAREILSAAEGEMAPLTLSLLKRPGALVLRIDDLYAPREPGAFQTAGDSTLSRMLEHGFADHLRVSLRGRHGNRAELIKRIPGRDVRNGPPAAAPPAKAPDDVRISIRFMEADEAIELAQAVFRSYGYSYDADWVYDPDAIADRIRRRAFLSCVGVTPDDEIVGHLGLTFPQPGARVAEAGQAVVDPRYRGRHLFTEIKGFAAEWAKNSGIFGLYSEATAAHPYSQKANLALGAHETGLLLGYIPGSVGYKAIDKAEADARESVTLFYLRTNDSPTQPVHAPDRYRDMVTRILEGSRLPFELAAQPKGPPAEEPTQLDLHVRRDHNQALLTVQRFGRDFRDVLGEQVRRLCVNHLDCIYLDLPLQDPGTAIYGEAAREVGFFFGGIFPNLGVEGDVLRLQYLNNLEVKRDHVATASTFAQGLLEFIFADRPESRPA